MGSKGGIMNMNKKIIWFQLVLDMILTLLYMASGDYFLAIVWLICTIVVAISIGINMKDF